MSWYETERDNRVIKTLEDISNKLNKRSGFIAIVGKDGKRRLLNVRHIEEVCEIGEHHCDIYMAFNCPNATDQDYFQVRQSYDEIVALIKEAVE